jgi:hypothetical protein
MSSTPQSSLSPEQQAAALKELIGAIGDSNIAHINAG